MIEQRLLDGSQNWFPPTPPVAAGARLQLPAAPDPATRLTKRALVVAFAALVLAGAAAAGTVLDLIPGIRVQRIERPPAVTYRLPPLYGSPMSLGELREALPFRLLLPRPLGRPNLAYLDHDRSGSPVATVVYGGHEQARLVLTQWAARSVLFDKLLGYDSHTEYVDVQGAPGIWIDGIDHDVFYLGALNKEERVGGYLAGNVLVWQRGSISYRLEADVPRDRALELAGSLESE
jgi:hypothetical protein